MIKRLFLYVLVAIFAALVAGRVHAQTVPDYYYNWTNVAGGPMRDPSADSACSRRLSDFQSNNQWVGYSFTRSFGPVGNNNNEFQCKAIKPPATTDTSTGVVFRFQCSASLPFYDNTKKVCVAAPPPPPVVCKAGEVGTHTYLRGESINGPMYLIPLKGASDGVCEVNMTDVIKCYKATDGKLYCKYTTVKTGSVKAAGEPGSEAAGPTGSPAPEEAARTDFPPQESPKGPCPVGTVQGGISADGVPICIGTGSAPKSTPPPPPKAEATKTEAMPDGSTKTTTTVTTTNADGSKTTETTTTITKPDGEKTTTGTKEVTPTPSGGAGRDDSKQDDEKYDLCKQNPMLTICRNSSVAGTCGTITCQGDAIQCATLRNIAAMECREVAELEKLEGLASTGLGNSILGGSDPMQGQIDGALKGTEVDLSPAALSDAAFLSSATCLTDRSFVAGGRTITVSFVKLCPAILPLRYAVLACSWIVAYLIVSRSILNG